MAQGKGKPHSICKEGARARAAERETSPDWDRTTEDMSS